MTNLDRFSRPLLNERFNPITHSLALDEQNNLNKHDLVQSYIWNLIDDEHRLPDTEEVLEHFQHIALDYDHVTDQIETERSRHTWE